jgi:anti-sigma-K factor RskA
MGWKPGESGNPAGSGQKPFLSALKRAIAQDDSKRLRESAEQLLTKAAEGEPWAINMLAERLDGKAPQSIDIDAKFRKAVELTDAELANIATAQQVVAEQPEVLKNTGLH